MNAADLIILGILVLLALMGLKSGILKPVSGIGGLIVGIILAIRYSAEAATTLENHIDGATLQRIAAFVAIVLVVTIASRLSAVGAKKLLQVLALGWLDHLAGSVAATAVGIVLAGTAVYILIGADFGPTRHALSQSRLAPSISRATLIVAPSPWCSSLPEGTYVVGQPGTDFKGLVEGLIGRQRLDQVEDLLGQDAGALAEVVKGTLSGSPEELVELATLEE